MLPKEEAIQKIKDAIVKSYSHKGEKVVQMNFNAVDTALANLQDIIGVSDAIMVARGDLGIEVHIEELPILREQVVFHQQLGGEAAGARAGMIAPDQTTFDYLRGLPESPTDFDAAVLAEQHRDH